MIIYGLTINNGGLLRVTESMLKIFDYLEKDFPLRIVYFAQEKIESLDENLFIFQPWNQNDPDQLTDNGVAKIVNGIKDKLKHFEIDRVIYESSMYRYWKHFDCKQSIDIHILERPLHKELIRHPQAAILDKITPDSIYSLLVRMGLVSMKRETEAFEKADHLIANSQTTIKDLNTLYKNEVSSKKIDFVPVCTTVNEIKDFSILTENYQREPSYIYFGRFHPQKGIHFLLTNEWENSRLSIKGFDTSLIEHDLFSNYTEKGIHFLEWTSGTKEIAQDLSKHDFVLFPSIYEPFGLALTESLMLGKICIANDNNSGHNEQIRHGENGFLINFNENLNEQLDEIKNMDRDELLKISENAKKGPFYTEDERLKAFARMLEGLI